MKVTSCVLIAPVVEDETSGSGVDEIAISI